MWLDLALRAQRDHRVERFEERHVAFDVAQMNVFAAFEPQPAQILLATLTQRFGRNRRDPTLVRRACAAELRREHQIFRIRVQRFGDQPIRDVRSVVPRGIDQANTAFDDAPQHRAGGLRDRAVRPTPSVRATASRRTRRG